jgi:hypothetical protein
MNQFIAFMCSMVTTTAVFAGGLPKNLSYKGVLELDNSRSRNVEMYIYQDSEDESKGRYKGIFVFSTESSSTTNPVKVNIWKKASGKFEIAGRVSGIRNLVFNSGKIKERDLYIGKLDFEVKIFSEEFCSPSESQCDDVTGIVDQGWMTLERKN